MLNRLSMMNVGLPQKRGQTARPLLGPGNDRHQEENGNAQGDAEHDDLPVELE